MAILKVLQYPDPILSKKSNPVDDLTEKERGFIQNMIDTMYQEDGVGLAAPQVGVSKRIIIISPNACPGEETVYINPEIIESSKEEEIGLEGCLSLPNISCEVRRPKKIKFRALDMRGFERVDQAQDFRARVIQHEIDHLNGVLIIDRVNFNQRQALLGSYRRL